MGSADVPGDGRIVLGDAAASSPNEGGIRRPETPQQRRARRTAYIAPAAAYNKQHAQQIREREGK